MTDQLYTLSDKILRNLYNETNRNLIRIFRDVYTEEGIEPAQARICLEYLMDREFVEIPSKGFGGIDGEEISITKEGRLFFHHSNLVEENENRKMPRQTGNTYYIKDSPGAIIAVDSSFQNAFNKVKGDGNEQSAEALQIIKSLVDKANNIEAVELFELFTAQLAKDKPNKTMLQSLWGILTTVIPAITATAGLVEKVMPLIL